MSTLSDLRPTARLRQIDLVKQAGIDVSDWKYFRGGARHAAANPKYCYEWVFVEPKEFVLLNLWHDMFEEEKHGGIVVNLNSREWAKRVIGVQKHRATKGDEAFQLAVKDKLPIRVIVITGRQRTRPTEKASHVEARLLDPVSWRITKYDWETGECTITRGEEKFMDQFSIPDDTGGKPKRRVVSGTSFVRDPVVRANVLIRAQGKCEWCREMGFKMVDGRIYLETHHVVSLSKNGPDTVKNVAALCPNHHREAHHGETRNKMRKILLKTLANIYRQ
ncbi:MAG: HNH endonuclease [Verrucomicrobia bacterium]|nr:HNH endonuclease [Verrucomicrobiota bacterium]